MCLTVGSRSNGLDGLLARLHRRTPCIAVVANTKARTAMQAVLLCKRASKPSDSLDYDPTTDTTMVC
jgi:hypothetical protein